MKRLWLLAMAAGAPIALVAITGQGCGSSSCSELADLCGTCSNDSYRQICEQAVADDVEFACYREKQRYDQACNATSDAGAPDAAGCAPDEATCPTGCADLNVDPNNCGDCGRVCAVGEACQVGQCVESCSAPFETCGSSCVDLRSDPENCNACGLVCPAGEPLCDDGQCVVECDLLGPRPTECQGGCVDLAADPLNCGACGTPCEPGQVCSLGTCSPVCQEGLTNCCGRCIDSASDPANCGGCNPEDCPPSGDEADAGVGGSGGSGGSGSGGGEPTESGADCTLTPATPACLLGECSPDCQGLTDCSGACVDLLSNASNCGVCDRPCAPTELCSGGVCVSSCAPGEKACLGGCVDTQSSALHCGDCGRTCDPGMVCSEGVCAESCAEGLLECPPLSGACVDPNADPNFCGSCDTACQATTPLCAAGTCVSGCPAGETPCNGSCVDLKTNFNNCGSCGNSCNDDNVCTADSCAASSCTNESFGSQICDDGNKCTIDRCDPLSGCAHRNPSSNELEGLCGDQVACTIAACEPDVGCFNEARNDECTNACDFDAGFCPLCQPPGGCTCGPCPPP